MKSNYYYLFFILTILFSTVTISARTTAQEDPIKIIRIKQQIHLFCANKISFAINSIELTSTTIHDLSLIAPQLIQNPNLQIEIAVHNDVRSDPDFSLEITQKRADAIKEFLVNYGVNPDNLDAIGFGDTRIINKCHAFIDCTNTEHLVNKRVELKIINPETLRDYEFIFSEN